ncbi:MAG TPA: ATP-binding protein [Steroidobacteraceae bacterium]|nr:ATP-binding protein [Steroidobacteraceae bacterium]
MPTLNKPIGELSPVDLNALCGVAIEDEQIDFKVTIPHKEEVGRDPWRDDRRIKEHGRDQLLATVVAFANSYGGDLLIGVRELQDSQPGKAEAIAPIAACDDAARRLSQAANECIEPPLPSLQVRGIATEADGSGVIVMRTPRSRMAPHRLKTTKDCYHRVQHETLPMTMRQIQDLTFNVAKGLEAVDRKLAEARQIFQTWLSKHPHGDSWRFSFRFAAVPTESVYVQRVHNIEAYRPTFRSAALRANSGRANEARFVLTFPFSPQRPWRPAIRGSELEETNDWKHLRVGMFCDGAIRMECVFTTPREFPDRHLFPAGWYLSSAVNLVEAAKGFRNAAGVVNVDYAIEAEIVVDAPVNVLRLGNNVIDPAGELGAGNLLLPRYVLGASGSEQETYRLVYEDFWHAIGVATGFDNYVLE